MELRSRSLSGAPLVRAYLEGSPDALRFYPGGDPSDPESYRIRAADVDRRFGREGRERLARMLTGGGEAGVARLARFVEEGGYAVTTGQQPGLFGGPLFTIYKALTAASLARKLESDLGRPVIPVFWIASEDHDWDEVRRISLPDPANELVTLELPVPEGARDAPLHRVPIGADLDSLRDALTELLPPSDFRDDIAGDLAASYRNGATLPGAFTELLRRQLDGTGIFFLSPEEAGAAETALPILLDEARLAAEVGHALAGRGADLEEIGHALQVPLLEGGVNLFLEGAEGRDRLFLEPDGRFRLRREGRVLTLDELVEEASADPTRLSPNVLLRPVVESALIPTLAYVAGPGETAYYAQTSPVFDAHGIGQPVVHPRLSALLIESKIGKVLTKFDLRPELLARPHHEVAGQVVRDDLPEGVRRALGGLRGAIAKGARELADAVKEVDPTLSGPVDHFRNQGFSLLDDVEKKVVQARKRESGITLQQIEKAQLHLFPGGVPQERVFPAVYYLVRYGPALFDRWIEAADAAVLLPEESRRGA